MKMRWLQVYDENGVDEEKSLQYWNKKLESWIDISTIRVPRKEVWKYQDDDDYVEF